MVNALRSARRGAFWVSLFLIAAGLAASMLPPMIRMPGESYADPLPPLTQEESQIAANLRRHIAAVASREHNMFKPDALEAAARYIETELATLGYVVETQPYESAMGTARNIEVQVRGVEDDAIVVGAHYDSVMGVPGANDNGSGIAAALELARLLRAQAPRRTLRFVWFVNEEPPFYLGEDMGSRRYVRHIRERGDRIAGMFSLETIGYYDDAPGSQAYPPPLGMFYPDTGNFIAFVSNLASRALLREAIGAFRRHARFPSEGLAAPGFIPAIDWSDHASFWEFGYPALMITDTAPFRYPHYHLASDTPDKVDYERLARVVTGLHGMLQDLAR